MIKKLFETFQRKQALAKMQDPLRPDWSAWAREPGKKAAFREALTKELIHIGFVTESSKLTPESYQSAEALLEKVESLVSDTTNSESITPYTYEGPDERRVLPIFSAPCMMQEFIQKSSFMKSGYMALSAVGQAPPEGLLSAAQYFQEGVVVLLNPYTRWAYTLEGEDFLWALERIKHQANETSSAIE